MDDERTAEGVPDPLLCVRATAGHDRGRLYLVMRQDDSFLWLTDGALRPLSKPKKKRKKHAALISHFTPETEAAAYCGSGACWQDMDTRRLLAALARQVKLAAKSDDEALAGHADESASHS